MISVFELWSPYLTYDLNVGDMISSQVAFLRFDLWQQPRGWSPQKLSYHKSHIEIISWDWDLNLIMQHFGTTVETRWYQCYSSRSRKECFEWFLLVQPILGWIPITVQNFLKTGIFWLSIFHMIMTKGEVVYYWDKGSGKWGGEGLSFFLITRGGVAVFFRLLSHVGTFIPMPELDFVAQKYPQKTTKM